MLARFADVFARDWSALNQPDTGPVALAVSGGPDSCALLALGALALPGRVIAATVDHGLRPESADEARQVATLCAVRGVPHATVRLEMAAGSGVQARARAARYAALADWARAHGAGVLATAHHADDQAETMIMRLNRGAGVRGLAGMRPLGQVPGDPTLPLARPLLGWRRADLAAVAQAAGMVVVHDPSNRDSRFERVRVRQGLAEAVDWLDPEGLAASAAHLADADAALEWMAQGAMARQWQPGTDGESGQLTVPPGLPRALGLRLLERVLEALGADWAAPRGTEMARWFHTLDSGGIATLAGVRGQGQARSGDQARSSDQARIWHFRKAPAHRT